MATGGPRIVEYRVLVAGGPADVERVLNHEAAAGWSLAQAIQQPYPIGDSALPRTHLLILERRVAGGLEE